VSLRKMAGPWMRMAERPVGIAKKKAVQLARISTKKVEQPAGMAGSGKCL
jgi:hypothetical protein